MKTQEWEAEKKIVSIACSIMTDPESWKDWAALHIEIPVSKAVDFQDVVLPVKAIAESYLHDIEGTTYFCDQRHIYIICKNVRPELMQQIKSQIHDLAFQDNIHPVNEQVYNLETEGSPFAKGIMDNFKPGFSPPPQNKTNEPPTRPKRSSPVKVLLVEDDPVTRWIVRNALKDECDFSCADSAGKLFSLYAANNPDIVFLDIGLPDKSGQDVLKWIMDTDPKACVIMMSSQDNTDNISRCIEIGAKGFVPKPFVKGNLLHYLHKYAG